MGWFSRSEIETQNEALKSDNERLKADLAAAQSQTETAAEITQKLAEASEELESCKSALSNEESAHAATKLKLEEAVAAITPEKTAERIAAAITLSAEEVTDETKDAHEANKPILEAVQAEVSRQVALTGRPPLAISDGKERESHSDAPHLDKFNSLTGAEATAYFKEHKKAINAEQRRASAKA